MFTRAQRHYLLPALVMLILVVAGVVASSRGNLVLKYVNKVVSSKRSISQKTSGRFDMYAAFPEMFWQSPIWGLGPGAASSTYRTSRGEAFALHSLVLHIGVEGGSIGLAILVLVYGALLRRAWVHRKVTGELVPLAGALCLCVDALAHNSFNPLMGMYLGMALTDLSRFCVLRPVAASPRRMTRVPVRRRRSRLIDSVLPASFG
jgi:O-antigen ligase